MAVSSHLDNLKKDAKRWLRKLRAGDAEARARFERAHPNASSTPTLRDVQHALARELGFTGWAALKQSKLEQYSRLAADMVNVYATGDQAAMARINAHYGRSNTVDDLRATVWRLMYKVRQAKGSPDAFQLPEAREMIARTSGFSNWTRLVTGAPKVPAYQIEERNNAIGVRREVEESDWDAIIGVMKDRNIRAFHSNGFLTDDAMKRIAELEHVRELHLGGSRQLSDDGLRHLARMPQLEFLGLDEYPGGKLTDRGLECLKHLPNLRTFRMTWQGGITDQGAANLKYCGKIEFVDLMGSPTGDGAVKALRGKQHLRRLQTGRLLSDEGLGYLREIPRFVRSVTGGKEEELPELLIDGPFSNDGLLTLAGMEGIYGLDLFWHVTGIGSDAFAVLALLPNLAKLGCDGELCTDVTMRHIASAPRLRRLRAQGSVATDDGYIALSKSKSLEDFWGRECPGLTGRGFVAMADMPSLHRLGVSCQLVDDDALASLPRFPSLRVLIPIDVTDPGFRHIGRCARLEQLTCMYCRTTTDAATEHVADLKLTGYYAGLTQITDRSLEILGRMTTLEKVELFETKKITDAGLVHLAKLPRLKEVEFSGIPNITYEGTRVFPKHVRVAYDQ